MAIIDGQGATFSFNGVLVGKVTRYSTLDGVTGDVAHKAMSRSYVEYRPTLPDFGTITLNLYRDLKDAGQVAMESARAAGSIVNCVLTLSDGSTRSFEGYVKKLPIVGSDNGLGTADAVIKVAGAVVSA